MNFCITPSDPGRKMLEHRYFFIFIAPVLFFVAINMLYALISDPYDGDLTRLGGYMESRYGWNGSQERFVQTSVVYANGIEDYDGYYQMVVIGDSFTFKSMSTWLDYLACFSGISVIAFRDSQVAVSELIRSERFKKTPPLYFVYESVERNLIERINKEMAGLTNGEFDGQGPDIYYMKSELPILHKQKALLMDSYARRVTWAGFDEIMAQGSHFFATNLKKLFFDATEMAIKIQIKLEFRGELFSSRDDGSALIFSGDLKARHITLDDIKSAVMHISKINEVVQKNGRTDFLLLIFPDKFSVYQEFFLPLDWPKKGVLDLVGDQDNLLRVDIAFRALIRNGFLDIYLPNNTHTSYIGDLVVADMVLNRLRLDCLYIQQACSAVKSIPFSCFGKSSQ